jgi:hypothetical protein
MRFQNNHNLRRSDLFNELRDFSPECGPRRLRSDPLALKLHEQIVSEMLRELV